MPPRKVFVSVVVPVRGDVAQLERCLEALEGQTYEASGFEVIVVDNGSNPPVASTLSPRPRARVLQHPPPGSYGARNVGIAHARGDVLAFTDADCVPSPDWLERGVEALDRDGVDIVGGRVRFTFSGSRGVFELCDAAINLNVEMAVRRGGAAMTANLFVRRRVFDAVGPFPAHVRSGGDFMWTSAASKAGFAISYADAAVVEHPARGASALFTKAFRVGAGQPGIWAAGGCSRWVVLKKILFGLRPPAPRAIRARLEQAEVGEDLSRVWLVWLAAWSMRLPTFFGRMSGFLSAPRGVPSRAAVP